MLSIVNNWNKSTWQKWIQYEKVDLNGILTLTIDVAGNMNHFPHRKPQVCFILIGQYHKSLTYLKFYNP